MSRKFVITDIHGCAATFRKLVKEEIKPEKNDEIYLLGDYIDRGPDSKDVFDFIFELTDEGFHLNCLRGNHEQFLLDSLSSLDQFQNWVVYNGGETTLKSFGASTVKDIPDEYMKFITSLPYFFEVGNFLLVHAGFNFRDGNPFQDKEAMLMIRNFPLDHKFLNGRKIIHGHTPTPLSQIVMNLKDPEALEINLDAGCVYKNVPAMNQLVALELNEWKLFVTDCVDKI